MNATATTSKLDMDKFAKVHRLMSEGATDGERAAARARAEAMASRAGMTLKQAASKMDAKARADDPFAGLREMMREGQEKRRRYSSARCQEALKRYGNVAGVFLRQPIEVALFNAATPFAVREQFEDYCGTKRWFTQKLGGAGSYSMREADPAAVLAIHDGWPMPPTLSGILNELRFWETLRRDRSAFADATGGGEYMHDLEANFRRELLEHKIRTRPITSWDDMQARLDWNQFEWESQWIDPAGHARSDADEVERLRRDFVILRKLYEAPAQNGHAEPAPPADLRRTNADKQRDIVSILDSEPGLSNREIARRCGVSPQTVGNWRSKRAAA